MKRLILPILLMSSLTANAKTLVVAIIDTGIDSRQSHLCKDGHKSFTGGDPLVDSLGHGTHISGLIKRNAGDADYCMLSLQFYDGKHSAGNNLETMVMAIAYAIDHKVDFINISAGGSEPSEIERKLILRALDSGITVVTAAGNEEMDLDKKCSYFPACYDKRIVVVGNLRYKYDFELKIDSAKRALADEKTAIVDTKPAPSSDYGTPVNRWEIGSHVLSDLPGGNLGYMTGTSQACAVATGKLVRDWKPAPVIQKKAPKKAHKR